MFQQPLFPALECYHWSVTVKGGILMYSLLKVFQPRSYSQNKSWCSDYINIRYVSDLLTYIISAEYCD